MPFFTYRAKTGTGELQKGRVEAVSLDKAAETLQEKGLFVIQVEPLVENSFTLLQKRVGSMKFADVVIFTRQLAAMIEAGVTLSMAISLLIEQARPNIKEVLQQLLNDLESGQSFSQSLSKFPRVFDKTYVYLIQAGESSGSLDVVLNRLADNMEEKKEFNGKVKGAMIYPTVVLLVMIAVGVVMMVVVVPKLLQVFEEFDAKLPLPTLILIAISNFITNYWWALLLIIAALIATFVVWYRGAEAKRLVDTLIFKLPIVGDLRKKTILANYTQTLSMLVKSGIPLVESLKLSSEAVNSINYRDHLHVVEEKVEKGVSLGQAIEIYDDFPMIMGQMIKVGEETGKLDDLLNKLSQYFRGESQRAVGSLMAAFEPLIMVVLGIAVAFLVVAIIMPIYDLTNQIQG